MGSIDRTRISRRAVLAGAGGVAGAVVLGTPSLAADEPGSPLTVPDKAAAPSAPAGSPPLANTPGLNYLMVNRYAFEPDSPAQGRVITPTGAHVASGTGYLSAALMLEPGAFLVELTASVTNTSGIPAPVLLETVDLNGATGAPVEVAVPTGGSTPQVVTSTAYYIVSDSLGYDLTINTNGSGAIRIVAARLGLAPPGYGFRPVTPIRVYDSRAGNPPNNVTKGPLSNGTRVINMFNGFPGLPVNVQGVLTNLTVVNTSASGFISLYKNGTSWPGTSSINWFLPGEIVANTAYTDVDAYGQAVAKVPASSSTDFFIDVVGYFT